MEHYARKFSRDGKTQLRESIGWGAAFFGIAIALFFGLYFLSPAVGGERSIGYEAFNPGPKIMGIYSGTVDEKGKGSLSIDSVSGRHIDSAKMTIDGKSIILQGDVRQTGAEKYDLRLIPALDADPESRLYGEYTLQLNLKKHTCVGQFMPANADKNGDTNPRTIAFTTSDEAAAAAAANPAETKKSAPAKKKTGKKASGGAAASAEAAESSSEAAEKVESGGFKLEPVESIPGVGSAQENREEPKKDETPVEKKERQPLKTPPTGF